MPQPFQEGGHPYRDIGVHALYLTEAFLGEIMLRLPTVEQVVMLTICSMIGAVAERRPRLIDAFKVRCFL